MIEPDDIDRKARRLQALLKMKFRIEADNLRQAMAQAGRRLPKRVHRAAELICQAQRLAGNPKLARMVDAQAIERAFSKVEWHLEQIDVRDRRIGAVLGMLGALAFNMILVVLLVLAVLYWRQLI